MDNDGPRVERRVLTQWSAQEPIADHLSVPLARLVDHLREPDEWEGLESGDIPDGDLPVLKAGQKYVIRRPGTDLDIFVIFLALASEARPLTYRITIGHDRPARPEETGGDDLRHVDHWVQDSLTIDVNGRTEPRVVDTTSVLFIDRSHD